MAGALPVAESPPARNPFQAGLAAGGWALRYPAQLALVAPGFGDLDHPTRGLQPSRGAICRLHLGIPDQRFR